jgi:hypothetical protein
MSAVCSASGKFSFSIFETVKSQNRIQNNGFKITMRPLNDMEHDNSTTRLKLTFKAIRPV